MNYLEAVSEIEGAAFSARVNVASDYRTFLSAVAQEASVAALSRSLSHEGGGIKLLRRAIWIARCRVDHRYETPHDAALATYVWLLAARFPDLGRIAAEAAAALPRAWWAWEVARRVLDAQRPAAAETTGSAEAFTPPSEATPRPSALRTGQSRFIATRTADLDWDDAVTVIAEGLLARASNAETKAWLLTPGTREGLSTRAGRGAGSQRVA